METNLELEQQYRNHKVVAFPNPRRCTTVRELAAANNSKCAASNNSLSPSQRARSLSAGRGRHRSSNEILQDVYDRASVSIRQGPSSDKGKGTTGEEMAPPPLTANNLVNNQDITQEMSPGVVPLGAFDGENYQARYRNAVAARDMVREPVSIETESQEQRRSRSLSRGRPQLAKRWPPLTVKQEESDPAGVAAAAPTIAVNHSNSPKRLVGVASPKRTLCSQNTPQRGQVELSSSYEYSSEEKKEDSAEQHFHGTPSIKERISVYGKSGSNTKSKILSGLRRTVDPSYAAQFHALRVQPPKIDIYEGNKDKDEKEDFDSSSIVGELLCVNADAAATITNPEDEQPVLLSPRNYGKPETAVSTTSRSFKTGNLAHVFLSAINKKQPLQQQQHQQHQQQQTTTAHSFKSPTSASTNCAPLAEIAVGETPDLIGNDGNSVAGVSTVSGEEFSWSQKKPSWQDRQRVSAFRPSAIPPKANNAATAAYNTNTNHNNIGPTSEMARLVEERVQARVADLEARIEQRLRTLVGQMEDRIMQRLDALELKMMSAVTKKK